MIPCDIIFYIAQKGLGFFFGYDRFFWSRGGWCACMPGKGRRSLYTDIHIEC